MAANDTGIQMKKFGEGFSGTGGLVDGITIDSSHESRSQLTRASETDLNLEMNLQRVNFGAGSSGGGEVGDEVALPSISELGEEDQDDGRRRAPQPVGESENTDHVVSITNESNHMCSAIDFDNHERQYVSNDKTLVLVSDSCCIEMKTCGPEEEIPEPDNLLVVLGCHCRGSLSRMHRKCIFKWYGPRIFQGHDYKCELCNAWLPGTIEHLMFRALIGQDSGGDILHKAMAPQMGILPLSWNALAEAPALPHTANGSSDFRINIGEITNLARHLNHPTISSIRSARNLYLAKYNYQASRNSQSRDNYPVCVMVFLVIVLIGFGVAFVKH